MQPHEVRPSKICFAAVAPFSRRGVLHGKVHTKFRSKCMRDMKKA